MLNEQDKAIINQGEWFNNCALDLQAGLLENAKIVNKNAGEALFLRGDANCGLYCVIQGVARVSGINGEGKEAVLSFIPQGVWFGEVALFDGGTRTHDVHAQTPLRLVHISVRCLSLLVDQTPLYWRDFGVLLSQKMRLVFSSLEDHALLSAEQKICKRLLLDASYDKSSYCIVMSQQQLADMTYLSRQTVNQILQSLRQQNMIELHYQRIDIIDKSGLVAILNLNL